MNRYYSRVPSVCYIQKALRNWGYCLGIPLFLSVCSEGSAQVEKLKIATDSIATINLDEVIVLSAKKGVYRNTQSKALASLDGYLASAQKIGMIKRGAYAWEPTMNNMGSERLSVTIDGMRIFGACTDKMDPVTSYVEVSNLSEARVASGQQGAAYGSTIGGAIDLELDKGNFSETGFRAILENGFETNNGLKVIGADIGYSENTIYLDGNITYRKAENYVAGGGKTVAYSQFEKYNVSANAGYKVGEGQTLTTSVIFDEARDVGYPALTMDVSLARALIASVGFDLDKIGTLSSWNSKIYFNTVTHVMDDSHRPDVPIRMDMPGWSDTFGFLTEAALHGDAHELLFKWDGFYNTSLAEMTMYPKNANESKMFMLTWPDVRTQNTGFYVEDLVRMDHSWLKISTRVSLQHARVADPFGLNGLRIFYPEMAPTKTRFLKSFSTQWHKELSSFQINMGLSYGDRAPSVSEAFGFYLFNSFDNHDYIGDPRLKNEESFEGTAKITWEKPKLKIGLEGAMFKMPNYILGEVNTGLSTMTIGAEGVKIYKNLKHASLSNISLDGSYTISPGLTLKTLVSYHRGKDNSRRNLPFISPVNYTTELRYHENKLIAAIVLAGAGKQVHFNPDFGEDQTENYAVLSLNFGKGFHLNKDLIHIKLGMENVFDSYYSTYTDWRNIPRMGRNFFATFSYAIR